MKETSHRSYVLVSSYEMYKLGKSMDRAERPGDGRKGDGKGHRGGGQKINLGFTHSPRVPSGAMPFTRCGTIISGLCLCFKTSS